MKKSVAALILVLGLPCVAWTGEDQQVKPLKIGVATFSHETCTFCPRPTGVAEWEFYGPPERGEAVLDAGPYIRGFVSQVREFGGVELVGLLSPRNAVGGSSGSWITKEAFDKYTGGIVKDLEEQGPFDGVFLALQRIGICFFTPPSVARNLNPNLRPRPLFEGSVFAPAPHPQARSRRGRRPAFLTPTSTRFP